jgi:serine O-acetyltransferase
VTPGLGGTAVTAVGRNGGGQESCAGELGRVADALAAADAAERWDGLLWHDRRALPSRAALERVIVELRAILFPRHLGPAGLAAGAVRAFIADRLEAVVPRLEEQVRLGLLLACRHDGGDDGCRPCAGQARDVTHELARRLPAIRQLLGRDAQAAYDGDPAATSPDEAVFCYPGLVALTHHRIAHELYQLDVPLIPRLVAEIAHGATGIDIHPGARIGRDFFIDHGTGVVIGETTVIGDRVRLYQGVTLGARSFPTDEHGRAIKGMPRHPIIEDDVTIYAGATVLGRITVGRGSSIGGNVWLTRGVPPGSRISQAQARDDLFDGGAGI